MKKIRVDQLMVVRGLAESREKAQRLIRSGVVRMNDQVLSKPGHTIADESDLVVTQAERFVSRGGEKLQGAFDVFNLDAAGLVCMDVGASTGGFTDCLLQHGATKIYAVDVGKGQLHWILRNDERVVVMEETNARYLQQSQFDRPIHMGVTDVSFISLTKILPAMVSVMQPKSALVALIKPQFEAGRSQVGKGGVVRDEAVRREVVQRIKRFGIEELHMKLIGISESPLRGPAGNIEYLSCWETT